MAKCFMRAACGGCYGVWNRLPHVRPAGHSKGSSQYQKGQQASARQGAQQSMFAHCYACLRTLLTDVVAVLSVCCNACRQADTAANDEDDQGTAICIYLCMWSACASGSSVSQLNKCRIFTCISPYIHLICVVRRSS